MKLNHALKTTEFRSSYDHNAKLLISKKECLARILQGCVTDFKNMEVKEIIPHIESVEIDKVPLEPGLTNCGPLNSLDKENYEPGEGTVFFDLLFNVTLPDSERMKQVLLCLLLARIKRLRDQRFIVNNGTKDWKEKIVHETLAAFKKGLDQDWNMTELAASHNLSAGYFRSIFREITGMPPRQFLNQIRINHAVDLIQHQGSSIYDAACSIGIHDLNYFSRLCRQLTGYPPSHFR